MASLFTSLLEGRRGRKKVRISRNPDKCLPVRSSRIELLCFCSFLDIYTGGMGGRPFIIVNFISRRGRTRPSLFHATLVLWSPGEYHDTTSHSLPTWFNKIRNKTSALFFFRGHNREKIYILVKITWSILRYIVVDPSYYDHIILFSVDNFCLFFFFFFYRFHLFSFVIVINLFFMSGRNSRRT